MNGVVSSGAKPPGNADGIDLLRFRAVRSVTLWRGFPQSAQGALLIAFVGLAWMAWGVFAPPGVNAKLFAKSNFVTLLI